MSPVSKQNDLWFYRLSTVAGNGERKFAPRAFANNLGLAPGLLAPALGHPQPNRSIPSRSKHTTSVRSRVTRRGTPGGPFREACRDSMESHSRWMAKLN